MTRTRDTIFALSSGRPPAAIAVIRVSGPQARVALEKTIGRVPEPRHATFAKVRDPQSGEVIDEGLALWFPAPKSETSEDMAELQVHGGRAVIAAVLAVLGKLEGFRAADAGEFTRRAFENGRMDLTAVEGLADLVAAETEAQRKQALRQMYGHFARKAEDWRKRLIEARALIEAGIDFSDEGDVPANLAGQAVAIIRPVLHDISEGQRGWGERLRDGLRVTIAGPPNVGKSTLMNRMAQRDVAIVSPHAGTTRDVIEVHLDVGGYPITLCDAAGIRPTDDPVEQEGVRRAQQSVRAADLVLWVFDGREITRRDMPYLMERSNTFPVWFVVNKTDLLNAQTLEGIERLFNTPPRLPFYPVSALHGDGIDRVVDGIADFAGELFSGEPALATRQRHQMQMSTAVLALEAALALAESGNADGSEELMAEQIRMATRSLERLTGRVDVEDILDVIFRDFCIGK